jgi:hypothetical protein
MASRRVQPSHRLNTASPGMGFATSRSTTARGHRARPSRGSLLVCRRSRVKNDCSRSHAMKLGPCRNRLKPAGRLGDLRDRPVEKGHTASLPLVPQAEALRRRTHRSQTHREGPYLAWPWFVVGEPLKRFESTAGQPKDESSAMPKPFEVGVHVVAKTASLFPTDCRRRRGQARRLRQLRARCRSRRLSSSGCVRDTSRAAVAVRRIRAHHATPVSR